MSDVRKKLRAKNKQKIKDKDSGQFAGRTLRADVRQGLKARTDISKRLRTKKLQKAKPVTCSFELLGISRCVVFHRLG